MFELYNLQMDANEDVLVGEQVTLILSQTGLVEVYTKAAAHQPSQVYLKGRKISTEITLIYA